MDFLGIHLTLLIGPTVPIPAPLPLVEALQSVEVTHSDEARSGFQITFQMGRSGPFDLLDYPLLNNPLLRPFNRVILIAVFNAMPRVLMDGIVMHQQLAPGGKPGASTMVISGEDVSVMMDQEPKNAEHPAQNEMIIALKLIGSYAQYGLIPMVLPPIAVEVPAPTERTPVQRSTDLAYLKEMAGRFGYVFYVKPGPAPGTNIAYWGPPERIGIPQSALSVNMGPATNVDSLNFQNNANAPKMMTGKMQDRTTNQALPVQTFSSTRPPLSSQPAWLVNQPNIRKELFQGSGLNAMQALARAQGATDAASDAVTAEGELDALRYGGLLQPRGLVGVRGAGYNHDGFYYVKRVTHTIRKGSYKQKFALSRDGLGSTTPTVIP